MTDTEQIRREIDQTRRELSTDVDNLHEKVSPAKVMERRVDKAKGAVSGAKDKIMGAAPSMSSGGDGGGDSAKDKVGTATAGNPLAAGLIAFGAGWLLSSLLPASDPEKQAAGAAKDMISEHSGQLTAPLHDAVDAVKDGMQEPVHDALDSVKSSATDAATTVKDDAASAKDTVSGGSMDGDDSAVDGDTASGRNGGPKHAAAGS